MEFEHRRFIGEKRLNDNILQSVKREVDLLVFIMNDFMKFKNNQISKDEFFIV